MRRADREVTDRTEMEAIIHEARFCTLAMNAENEPYAVPLSFGYESGRVYVHGANQGHKTDLLRRDPRVCLTFVSRCETIMADQPCFGTTLYASVIATGIARFVTDATEKQHGLDVLMAEHGAPGAHTYDAGTMKATQIIAVDIISMTGKRLG